MLAGAQDSTGALDIPLVVDSVLSFVLYNWDMSDETYAAIEAAGVPAATATQVGTWLAAGMGLADVGNALLPYILGNVTGLQAQLSAAGTPLTHSNGASVVVDDSGQDLDIDDFDYDAYYYYDEMINHVGGRIWAQSYATCFPAKWTQRVDSHWSYMGALSTVHDNNITVDRFELKGNYPNPFNPTTKIRFTNDRSSNVKVTVYALNGEKVATIMDRQVNTGAYDVSLSLIHI